MSKIKVWRQDFTRLYSCTMEAHRGYPLQSILIFTSIFHFVLFSFYAINTCIKVFTFMCSAFEVMQNAYIANREKGRVSTLVFLTSKLS